jgi:hypothetical protein
MTPVLFSFLCFALRVARAADRANARSQLAERFPVHFSALENSHPEAHSGRKREPKKGLACLRGIST